MEKLKDWKVLTAVGLAVLVLAFFLGRSSVQAVTVTETRVETLDASSEQIQKAVQEARKSWEAETKTRTIRVIETRPDGSKSERTEETRETKERTTEEAKKETESSEKSTESRKTEESKVVKNDRDKWMLGVQVPLTKDTIKDLQGFKLTPEAGYRFLGPLWLKGGYSFSTQTFSLGVMVTF
jgi:outer membrane murein-binding lipoprotein Lpp